MCSNRPLFRPGHGVLRSAPALLKLMDPGRVCLSHHRGCISCHCLSRYQQPSTPVCPAPCLFHHIADAAAPSDLWHWLSASLETGGCAGQEVSALAWVAQQASPVIAQTLAQVSTLDDVIISLPPVQDVPLDSMFPTFALALEFAYSGSAQVQASSILPLWALAVALQVMLVAAQPRSCHSPARPCCLARLLC